MKTIVSMLKYLIGLSIVLAAGVFVITQYSWVFSKKVTGEIVSVKRVTQPSAVFSAKATDAQMHSYSILVKGEDGTLFTASGEDRQWEVAAPGYCVQARFYVYPPWELEKAGTYFNARVLKLFECSGKNSRPSEASSPEVKTE